MYKMVNGKKVTLTSEEENKYNARVKEWEDTKSQRQLKQIKQERLQRLIETDWMSLGDVTMPDYIKTWRQSLRDIPANFDSSKYDDLLARDENGVYIHSIWTQPTE
tara:strand:+ start:1021 stop:1338 length:318 start_codon:yes stop_codon:yes gene_type:complete